jgi:hypothetical protein
MVKIGLTLANDVRVVVQQECKASSPLRRDGSVHCGPDHVPFGLGGRLLAMTMSQWPRVEGLCFRLEDCFHHLLRLKHVDSEDIHFLGHPQCCTPRRCFRKHAGVVKVEMAKTVFSTHVPPPIVAMNRVCGLMVWLSGKHSQHLMR